MNNGGGRHRERHLAPVLGTGWECGRRFRRAKRGSFFPASAASLFPQARAGGRPVSPPLGPQHAAVPRQEPRPTAGNAPRAAYTSMPTPPRRLRPPAHTRPPTSRPPAPNAKSPAPRAAGHAGSAALHAGSPADRAVEPFGRLRSLSGVGAIRPA